MWMRVQVLLGLGGLGKCGGLLSRWTCIHLIGLGLVPPLPIVGVFFPIRWQKSSPTSDRTLPRGNIVGFFPACDRTLVRG